MTEEVGFGDAEEEVFALGTGAEAEAEALTGTGEAGPIGDVEVPLGDFDHADEVVDRAEAGAELDLAGFLFDEGD